MLEDSQFLLMAKLIMVYGWSKINLEINQREAYHNLVLHKVLLHLFSWEVLLKAFQALDETVQMRKMSNQIAGIGKVLIIRASKILQINYNKVNPKFDNMKIIDLTQNYRRDQVYAIVFFLNCSGEGPEMLQIFSGFFSLCYCKRLFCDNL